MVGNGMALLHPVYFYTIFLIDLFGFTIDYPKVNLLELWFNGFASVIKPLYGFVIVGLITFGL
jgi:hypothetical protein